MTTPTDAEIMREAAMVGGLFDDLAIGYQSEDILKFARAVLAKWGQPQAVAGGDPVARVLLDCSGQPMVNPELLAAKELADPVAFDTMYPHRAPHRVAMLYPDAPPPQAVREPLVDELRWCGNCGGGVTFFCRSKTVCECPMKLGRVVATGITKGGQHGAE